MLLGTKGSPPLPHPFTLQSNRWTCSVLLKSIVNCNTVFFRKKLAFHLTWLKSDHNRLHKPVLFIKTGGPWWVSIQYVRPLSLASIIVLKICTFILDFVFALRTFKASDDWAIVWSQVNPDVIVGLFDLTASRAQAAPFEPRRRCLGSRGRCSNYTENTRKCWDTCQKGCVISQRPLSCIFTGSILSFFVYFYWQYICLNSRWINWNRSSFHHRELCFLRGVGPSFCDVLPDDMGVIFSLKGSQHCGDREPTGDHN